MTSPAIPQTSPLAAYLEQRDAIDAAIRRVLDSGRYVMGEHVAGFEREFAAYVGARHAIGVGSGTEALHLALRAAGVGEGDLVVTVANTAVATAAAIEMAGARVAFADIDDETQLIDPRSVEAILGAHEVRAIAPVHLFGAAASMHDLVELARRHGALVIEDCAQAHGTTIAGGRVGTTGEIAAFSFYPTKNLGAIGDGGAIVTNDDVLAERVRLLRQYGWKDRYVSAIAGFNSRLDEIQAAILSVKLSTLDRDNERRRAIAARYRDALRGTGVRAPHDDPGHVYHQFVVRTEGRDELQAALQERGIGTLVHYPVPIHRQPAYAGRALLPPGGLPVTERAASEILSLPMYPQLDDRGVERVCAALAELA